MKIAWASRKALKTLASLLFVLGHFPDAANAAETYTENPGDDGNGEITVGPDYPTDKDLTDLGNPKGKAFEFRMKLADSKIFRGDDKTLDPVKRPVRVERKIS